MLRPLQVLRATLASTTTREGGKPISDADQMNRWDFPEPPLLPHMEHAIHHLPPARYESSSELQETSLNEQTWFSSSEVWRHFQL